MNKPVTHLPLIACLALWLLAAPGTEAASPALRFSGSFLQYWDEMQSWPPENWRTLLDSMSELKMNTVIVQMQVRENDDGTLHSFIGPAGQPDATETILSYADTNGFKVFLGLYLPNWNHDMLGSNFLFETQNQMATVAQQSWNRYLSGNRHPSFAGWYIPYEPWTADYQPGEVELLRSFFQSIHASCQLISGDAPLAVSPFISAYRPPPCVVEQHYRQLLDQSGIGILLLQDSVGAQQWESNIPQRVEPYARAFQNACQATGVKLWANIESFQISSGVFGPCDANRLKKQFEAEAPFAENSVTFDFLHYMNPKVFLSSWDQTRRTRMQQLFSDYKAAFVDVDYAPFAQPIVSASVLGNDLALIWGGNSGDQFQVQFQTNITDAAWTQLGTPILASGKVFSTTDRILGGQSARCYRVQKLLRLQVPDSLVYIPPGTFLMGTPADDPNKTASELSQLQVTLTRGFWIGQFEVTQSEYQNLVCTNPARFTTDLNLPVENVTWQNAMDYCALLTQRERQAMRLPADYAYRLPTEAEWEYAARAGTTNRFSFGDNPALLADHAWFSANSLSTTHLVGQLQPNPWGLKDIQGNVLEWCWDWIGSASTQPVTDFVGGTNDLYHAVRGGAWSFPWIQCRSSWRVGFVSGARRNDTGFRVVLAPVTP